MQEELAEIETYVVTHRSDQRFLFELNLFSLQEKGFSAPAEIPSDNHFEENDTDDDDIEDLTVDCDDKAKILNKSGKIRKISKKYKCFL